MKRNSLELRAYSLQRKIIFLASCYLLLATLTGCVKREIKNIDSKGKNIICFGDSLTLGYGVNPGEDYPASLAKMLDIPVVNTGIDGDTSIEAIKRIKTDILDKDPLLVIIEFGGNDFLRKIPLDETIKNVEKMIQEIESKGAMVAIVDISSTMLMSDYGRELRRLSKKYNTIFIPRILSGILTNPSLKSDFIHPNAEGYKVVARKICQTIIPYLNQNALLRKSANQMR